MITFDEFQHELHRALTHLYEVGYTPPQALYSLVGCEPGEGMCGVRSAVVRMIEMLEPQFDTAPGGRLALMYRLLYSRFVLGLTQENTARRLHVSPATAWRLQRKAIHLLARAFWEQAHHCTDSPDRSAPDGNGDTTRPGESSLQVQSSDWHWQVKRELASLRASAPGATCSVMKVVDHLMELRGGLLPSGDTDLRIGFVQPNLMADVPSSLLSQILITTIRRLAACAQHGRITIFARLEDGAPKLTLTAPLAAAGTRPLEKEIVGDIVGTEEIPVVAQIVGDNIFVWISLPSAGAVNVLVIDDNPDMAEFYRRITEGTNYRIVHVTEGSRLTEVLQASNPDIVVLDVLLPDINGWELLMRLRTDPAMSHLPVIVCTVVREEELALSLGAAAYLPKPVRAREFIQTLDRIHSRLSAGLSRSQASTAVPG